MKCKEVEYFRYGDEYYVALNRESCINFILHQYEDLYYSEIGSALEKVQDDTAIYNYVFENINYKGLNGSIKFDVIKLKEIYVYLYDKDDNLPLQIVYDI